MFSSLLNWYQHRVYSESHEALWPDDMDAVPQWRLEREEWAAEFGVKLPNYRTQREFEMMVDACVLSCPPLESEAVRLEPALPVERAARLFLDAIQKDLSGDDVVEYHASELAVAYTEWCANRNLTPSAIDHVKKHLVKMPGVQKILQDSKPGEQRRRLTVWLFSPAVVDPALVDPIPMRLAA